MSLVICLLADLPNNIPAGSNETKCKSMIRHPFPLNQTRWMDTREEKEIKKEQMRGFDGFFVFLAQSANRLFQGFDWILGVVEISYLKDKNKKSPTPTEP